MTLLFDTLFYFKHFFCALHEDDQHIESIIGFYILSCARFQAASGLKGISILSINILGL